MAQPVDGTGYLLAVADGMGGHAAGELASSVAISELSSALSVGHRRALDGDSPIDLLGHALRRANSAVYKTAQSQGVQGNMGTTLTAALVIANHAYIGHIGDSRAYLVRHGRVLQITKDHSFIQEQVDMGELTSEQAAISTQRSVLTRAVGVSSCVDAEFHELPMLPGDWLFLCSDGLWQYLSGDELAHVADRSASTRQASRFLLDLANTRGGSDNITVVAARHGGTSQVRKPAARGIGTKSLLLGLAMALALATGSVLYYQTRTKPVHKIPVRPQSGKPAAGLQARASVPPLDIKLSVRRLDGNHIQISGTRGCEWQVWQGEDGVTQKCRGILGLVPSPVELRKPVGNVPNLDLHIEPAGSRYRFTSSPRRDLFYNRNSIQVSHDTFRAPSGGGWYSFYLTDGAKPAETVVVKVRQSAGDGAADAKVKLPSISLLLASVHRPEVQSVREPRRHTVAPPRRGKRKSETPGAAAARPIQDTKKLSAKSASTDDTASQNKSQPSVSSIRPKSETLTPGKATPSGKKSVPALPEVAGAKSVDKIKDDKKVGDPGNVPSTPTSTKPDTVGKQERNHDAIE